MTKRVYAAVLENSGYIVGDANAKSGMYVRSSTAEWHRLGWPNIRAFGLHVTEPRTLMAAGNGLLRSNDGGESWRVTTDWRVTEVLDVDVSPDNRDTVLIATAHGIHISHDDCSSWMRIAMPEDQRFVQAVRYDITNSNVIVAAAEAGILRSDDGGASWRCVDARAGAIRSVRQCSDRTGVWWAVSATGEILRSANDGVKWTPAGPDHSMPLYSIHVDSDLVVASGYLCGAIISTDRGESWKIVQFPDDRMSGHAIVTSPDSPDDVLIGTTGNGLYSLNLETEEWRLVGLPDATIRGLYVA
ncbi:MAG: hypothetical protein HKN43_03050 [Rhodothermales bacterium]|nr:hypothetical protein [Rhodothermales bacterium]